MLGTLLLAEEAARPLLERLDPPKRAAVLMALLALVLLAMGLVAATMVGGRWVRRLAQDRPAPRKFAKRPDAPQRDEAPPTGPGPSGGVDLSGETLAAPRPQGDTRAD